MRRLFAATVLVDLAFGALAFGALASCTPGGGGAIDGGQRDAVYEVSLNLPDGCPPPSGNDKGVGAPCTMGGKQCKSPLHCTCDPAFGVQLSGVPCICTLFQLAEVGSADPCGAPLPANFCGSNATCCSYLTVGAYCVPSICLEGNVCPVVAP
jgi:hypothetical protein